MNSISTPQGKDYTFEDIKIILAGAGVFAEHYRWKPKLDDCHYQKSEGDNVCEGAEPEK